MREGGGAYFDVPPSLHRVCGPVVSRTWARDGVALGWGCPPPHQQG